MILDGKEVSLQKKTTLKQQLQKNLIRPCLVVLQIGNNEASNIYIKAKEKACQEVGINFKLIKFNNLVDELEVLNKITELNNDDYVNGILVQLPISNHLNEEKILNSISPLKDVDGLTEINLGKLFKGQKGYVPCTPMGIITLLKEYKINLNCHIVVVGRSNLVGKPLVHLLLKENATVTICHSKTNNLEFFTKQADILITAVGKKFLINKNMVKKGVIIVDVGITREDGKIYGDVDINGIKASYYTPVPGGIGPMTIAMLLNNVNNAYLFQNNQKKMK